MTKNLSNHLCLGEEEDIRCAKKITTFVCERGFDEPTMAVQFFYGKQKEPLQIRGRKVKDHVLYFNRIAKSSY